MKTGLFPTVPKELAKLSDTELATLLGEFEHAAELIDKEDEEFLAGMTADEIIEQFEAGAEAIKLLRVETQARVEAAETYQARKAEISGSLKAEAAEEDAEEESGDESGDEAEGDAADDADADTTDDSGDADSEDEAADESEAVSDPIAEKVLVADAEPEKPRLRRAPPAPAKDRIVTQEREELAFVASGLLPSTPPGSKLKTRGELAGAVEQMVRAVGNPTKSRDGREERFRVATLDYRSAFPDDRVLVASDLSGNAAKVAGIGSPFFGSESMEALVASGGFCAPFEPIYTMPQLAVRDRPVRDALPNFRAERGGINVPTPTTMGDAAGAISLITADADALGGTFATKACLDLDCPTYTETAVTILSHCREFGNLNAMAWPEKIAHENDLTMAEHARIAESYLLGRIKTLSVQVTNGADTLGALIYLVDGILKSKFGIRSRLRMPNEARFTALLPRVLLDILELDTVSTQFDRYRSGAAITEYLASVGIDVTWYMDTPIRAGDATAPTGTSQIADASQTAAALDGFPANVQWAIFPSGTFLHLDMAELNLGIVRDSTLNSTNDFQVFGESFENVARIGPEQAAYWVTTNLCPTGVFPALGTARACE